MKKKLIVLSLVALMLLSLAACGSKADRIKTDEEKSVSATLETDKSSYKEGETIHYKLTVKNMRNMWIFPETKFQYTNTDGLIPVEGELDNLIPELKYNEFTTIEGDLTADMSVLSKASREKRIEEFFEGFSLATKAYADDIYSVKLSPYVKVTYAGKEVTLRVSISATMRQETLSLGDFTSYKTACVHDPSIFLDKDGTYYILGTHLTGASTTDLVNWKQLDSEIRANYSKETREKIRAWNKDEKAGEWFGYLWAPDIVYNPNLGKYCVYLSANGDDWKSNIVMLTADSVTGPYEYVDSIVYGGFSEEDFTETDVDEILGVSELPERYITNGVKNKKWGDEYPNCIDPCVFFDEDGELWMSYGSWSGGIFMLKLDKNTGLRDTTVKYETNAHSDAYFGKKIAGGKYVSGEASYIQHIGDYYYLFISYGELQANGGYNVRVFRSSKPDGDYVDALGKSAFYDKYIKNYNDSCGVRLFGAYRWRNFATGQVAQGHNSAFTDADGKSYIVFHTRTSNGTEQHYVKAQQLFVNREGWLVAAPYQTNGEGLLKDSVKKNDLVGTWEVIMHNLNIDYKNKQTEKPAFITLEKNGKITGDYEGTWTFDEKEAYIDLIINETDYSGVALTMKIEYTSLDTLVFTALGVENQITLWGSKCIEE